MGKILYIIYAVIIVFTMSVSPTSGGGRSSSWGGSSGSGWTSGGSHK